MEDKPHLMATTNLVPGICKIHRENESSFNYHVDLKYLDQFREESVLGGLNYDARDGTIFYWAKIANVDHSRLYKVRLNNSDWESILDQDDDFRDMSYDWITKNLYIIMGLRSFMVAVNVNKPWNPTVIMDDRPQLTSLAVHPNKGYLFFVETSYWRGVQNKIYRAHLDGSNVFEFNRGGSDLRYYIADIIVDFYTDRLYWSMPGADKIQHSNLDGENVKTIGGIRAYSGQLELSSRALAVDRRYLYYRTSMTNSIRRLEKSNDLEDPEFELHNMDPAPMTEIMVVSQKSQRIRKDHPCRDNRGGCDKYCFAVPQDSGLKRVCKCSFTEVLSSDGVKCVRKNYTIFGS